MVIDSKTGTPIWFDLGSDDVPQSVAFYTSVFDWDASQVPGEDAGGYTTYTVDGQLVAAVAPHQIDTPYHRPYGPDGEQGMPAIWTVYFKTDQIDDLPERVTRSGGQVIMMPMDVFGLGHMAVFADPQGAAFAVWQPGTMRGAELVNQIGAVAHVELVTDKVDDTVRDFYSKVLGLEPSGEGYETAWSVGGRIVAGTQDLSDSEAARPHWHVAIGVANCDAAVATATSAGATVEKGPHTVPGGLRANLKDPSGAGFSVLELGGART